MKLSSNSRGLQQQGKLHVPYMLVETYAVILLSNCRNLNLRNIYDYYDG